MSQKPAFVVNPVLYYISLSLVMPGKARKIWVLNYFQDVALMSVDPQCSIGGRYSCGRNQWLQRPKKVLALVSKEAGGVNPNIMNQLRSESSVQRRRASGTTGALGGSTISSTCLRSRITSLGEFGIEKCLKLF